ncbi:fructokinase [Streptomyces sp. 846.5]|nr:carbohydrate kinase [Streptomyces sp. 846.5]TDT97667.1 fructokinase [Streptomyces sp. 846.5]
MSAPESPVLVIGEALTDILLGPDGRQRACPGGSPANVALGLARLGHPVRLATRVGRDEHGRQLQRHLGDSGVVLTDGSVVEAPTSTATATIDDRGAASYEFDIVWELPEAATESARTGLIAHLHIGSIAATLAPGSAQVLAAVTAARSRCTVSYDPNIRPALLAAPAEERPRVERLVAASDVVKASEEDLGWLYPGQDLHEVADRWIRSGPALVVITRSGDGAEAFWPGGNRHQPPTPVEVVDTVGAGDAFMSGLISGLLEAGLLGGGSVGPDGPRARALLRYAKGPQEAAGTAGTDPGLVEALSRAARAAALTCARPGADPPTRVEFDRALSRSAVVGSSA